jgi:hypothetical protein
VGIIAKDMFVKTLSAGNDAGADLARTVYASFGNNAIREPLRAVINGVNVHINRAAAGQVYDLMREYILQNGYLGGKYLRPWDIDKGLYARLDRSQTWWGFEFETGYNTVADRRAVLSEVWDTLDNTCFDSEGEGRAAVEVTFAPEEVSKYQDGSAQALKFMDILDRHQGRVYNGGNENVGTHINMSHPKLTRDNLLWVCYCMIRTLAALPISIRESSGSMLNVRRAMFGRTHLYGGFFPQYGDGDAVWLEGKLFRTVYTTKEFLNYMKVCEGLTKCMDFFINHDPAPGPANSREAKKYLYVDNLYDVVYNNAELDIKTSEYLGNLDGARNGNAINGMLASDNPSCATTVANLARAHSVLARNIRAGGALF